MLIKYKFRNIKFFELILLVLMLSELNFGKVIS
jgi:hypothetical protein